MDKFSARVIDKTQHYRSTKLASIAKILVKLGISANILTTLSLFTGLLAIFYLFTNYWLFLLFAVLHLLFDAIDGVVARLTKTTIAGKYYDLTADNLLPFLAFIKIGWLLQDVYAYIIAGLFFLTFVIYFASKLKAPVLGFRTVAFIILAIASYPAMPYMTEILTVGYLVGGVSSVYVLARQLQWFLKRTIAK